MEDKKKILHVGISLSGIDTSIRGIIKHLDVDMFEVVLIKGKEKCDEFKSSNGKTIKTYEISLTRAISPIKDIICLFEIVRIIKKEKPNLIHVHSAKPGFIGRLSAYIVKVPTVYTPQAFSYLSTNNMFKGGFFLFLEKMAKRLGSTLLASSESERNRGIIDVGFKKEETLVWNNCIEPLNKPTFKLSSTIVKISPPFICSIGRPSYQKNTEMLIETFKKVKNQANNLKLVILGVGHYSPSLKQVNKLIKKYGLEDHVILLDWVSREDALILLSDSLIYTSTSRYEGLSYAALEALALGKPCILTNCDGNRDCVIDGKTGYLVEEGNVEHMADRILYLIQDQNSLDGFGQNALKYFEENFSIVKNIKKLELIYSKLSSQN